MELLYNFVADIFFINEIIYRRKIMFEFFNLKFEIFKQHKMLLPFSHK